MTHLTSNAAQAAQDASVDDFAPTRANYESEGYVIFRSLVPASLIDSLLEDYRTQIVSSKRRFFRQSTATWQKNKLTPAGNVRQSFLDIHDLPYTECESVCRCSRAILCHPAVREALSTLTGERQHSLMQSMLFDQNAATGAHQDWYFLDSVPRGHLLAGWFALEDIDKNAGRFYVLPRSNRQLFETTPDESISTSLYVQKVTRYRDTHAHELKAPALKKGDVLFWSSATVHGSLPTIDPRLSRKSLTAHYMPSRFEFGSERGPVVPVLYHMYEGMPVRSIDRPYSRRAMAGRFVDHHVSEKYPRAYRQYLRLRGKLAPGTPDEP